MSISPNQKLSGCSKPKRAATTDVKSKTAMKPFLKQRCIVALEHPPVQLLGTLFRDYQMVAAY